MGRQEQRPYIPPEGEQLPIGTILRALRWHKGIPFNELIEKLDSYTKGFISEVETNKVNTSTQSLREICDALGITKEELFSISRKEIIEWVDYGPKYKKKTSTRKRATSSTTNQDILTKLNRIEEIQTEIRDILLNKLKS